MIKVIETLKGVFKRYRGYRANDIDYENAKIILKNNKDTVLLDVRSPQEYKEGHLENAINIPLYNIEQDVDKILPDKEKTIIVYCQSGNRSKKAINILAKKHYNNLYNIAGGLDEI